LKRIGIVQKNAACVRNQVYLHIAASGWMNNKKLKEYHKQIEKQAYKLENFTVNISA
jgi:hypothetical protein